MAVVLVIVSNEVGPQWLLDPRDSKMVNFSIELIAFSLELIDVCEITGDRANIRVCRFLAVAKEPDHGFFPSKTGVKGLMN